MIEETERHGLRRLHHHFLGAYLVQIFGTGTATDEHVVLARRLLAEDPLFRNRAQVDLALAIGLVDRGDPAAAEQVLAVGRRFARNDEERSVLCVGRAELAWACGDRARADVGTRRAGDVLTRVLRAERVRRERGDPQPVARRRPRATSPASRRR